MSCKDVLIQFWKNVINLEDLWWFLTKTFFFTFLLPSLDALLLAILINAFLGVFLFL